MNNSRFTISLVVGLFGFLGILAYLQYAWIGQISDGKRERLQRILQSDTRRFAEDFNREMQNAYFNFQIDAKSWREKNYAEFNDRYKFWLEKTAYPELIKDFSFVETETGAVLRFNKQTKVFEAAEWSENLVKLKPKIASAEGIEPIAEEIPAFLMPVREMSEKLDKILVRTPQTENIIGQKSHIPKKIGVLVIELDANVIKNQILPDLLVNKYFSPESTDYKFSVTNNENLTIFQTSQVEQSDISVKFFELSPDNFVFFSNREMIEGIQQQRGKTMIFSRIESQKGEITTTNNSNRQVEMTLTTDDKPRLRVFERSLPQENAVWTLNVQHTAGSLDQFITNKRRENLAISFGILSLLGISIVMIFLSTQRAKLLAQRQIDFVSSVSHEFRTPLAVIYSAGENLADGVAKESAQVSLYGDLIKGEGRKLSAMVEQILDFAGANAGKKKYDMRSTDIKEIIEDALAECQPIIKDFRIETEIEENLPPIIADKNALGQVIKNLLANSIKYSGAEKYIKLSAKSSLGRVKITVEDKGIGIEKNDLKHIFEPFYRAKAVVDEQIHGNGLGLSLVKEAVEAHNGKISAESEIGKGSKFIVQLPFIK